ncbi:MAG: class I SAM-dependent methyltransferase [Syntrophaceae bacterium]|nr:class I SAM-dependent methyltransferase [Syntrophaceae bacterium]
MDALKADQSNGYESISDKFIANRNSNIGVKTVETWMKSLITKATVLDIGCGFGIPYAELLINAGFNVYGIDASQTLIKEFQLRFQNAIVVCETAEASNFFNLKFDGIIAIGLIFLLSERSQLKVLQKVSNALNDHGKFLFTAPLNACSWNDILTGRKSQSLGKNVYVNELSKNGLILTHEYTDKGENHYFDFEKNNVFHLPINPREPKHRAA